MAGPMVYGQTAGGPQAPGQPAGGATAALKRAAFRPPPDFEPVTSLWVAVGTTPQGVTLTLQHDYPDFKPESGWRVTTRGGEYTVVSADGRAIRCQEGGAQ